MAVPLQWHSAMKPRSLNSFSRRSVMVTSVGQNSSVVPESAEAVAAGLRNLLARTVDERAAMGARGHAFVVAHHSYRVLAQRFIDAVVSR